MNRNSGSGKLTRKEREFQARRQEILAAATRLFARQGYHGTTMSEIAREAEFSTGSLYNFFKNKEELYFSLLEDKIGALEAEVYAVLEGDAGVEEKLRNYVDKVLTFFEAERDFFRIYVEQRTQFEMSMKGEFAEAMYEKVQKYLVKMVLTMEQGVREGLFRPLDPAELATIFVGLINNFLVVYINTDMSASLREKGGLILDIFFHGVGRREGGGVSS
jgi:AcrR family transcriptional regulator